MIKITLKELNASFPALTAAAESLTAGKMKYRFARVLKSAKEHIELFGTHLAELAEKHGAQLIGGSRFEFDTEKQKVQAIAFNKAADEWMKSETVELWGDPEYFTFDEIDKATDPKKPISAATIADLLWLISDRDVATESPKAASATA